MYILIERNGQLYKPKETETENTLLNNLQFIVGNKTIFFIQFCTLLVIKALIIGLFSVAVYRYLKAHSNMSNLNE